ncbi:hypothetical protein [Flavobacterium sp. HNIBRBA15423]|uniref:hypothetical protein n=1 Tax=Flavobacterium sp. HNIBRBA15423 TaxID=3458683 RepID=UPI004044D439
MKGKHWIIVIIILVSGYNIINYFHHQKSSKKWSIESESILIKKCLSDSKNMSIEYPILTKEYCTCSMKKIMDSISQDEYLIISKKSMDEQKKILLPLFQDCLSEYQTEIKKLKIN